MALRTKAELKILLDNLVKTNGAEEITGAIMNSVLTDYIDSLQAQQVTGEEGDYQLISVTYPIASVVSTNLNITLPYNPEYDVAIALNGHTYDLGGSAASKFYFKDASNTVVRAIGDIVATDVLHYNSTALGFTIDTLDVVTLTYIVKL